MKAQVLGRQELLQWINQFTECDYPKIEALSDGIGYAQVIDAIHPQTINLVKFNLVARFPDDYLKNLKLLEEAFQKLKIPKQVPIDNLSKSKFAENMSFLQWLYNYATKQGPMALRSYKGYQKRIDAFEKQSHRFGQMNTHLIPNSEFLRFKQNQYNEDQDEDANEFNDQEEQEYQEEEEEQEQEQEMMSYNSQQRLMYIDETIGEMEGDLKTKMEYNWKLIYALDDMLYQRDVLYNILAQIDQCVLKAGEKSVMGDKILAIINEQPDDFSIMK